MPLNEPPLALDPDPRSVQEARRWVESACRRLGRGDLVECGELGISELVTNALLHAEPPFTVRLRGTRGHPRVEVTDGSAQLPMINPHPRGGGLDDLMATVGRGLDIVAMCAVAWGVTIEQDGKCIWFEPARVPHQDVGPEAAILPKDEDLPAVDVATDPDAVPIIIRELPVASLTEFRRHYQELRRELRLLSLAHQADYPLAQDLTHVFHRFERSFPTTLRTQYLDAVERGDATFDLNLRLNPSATTVIEQMLELLDLADEFCRAQRLLALARTPQQRTFQQWYFGEFVRQARGEEPTAWPPTQPDAQHVS